MPGVSSRTRFSLAAAKARSEEADSKLIVLSQSSKQQIKHTRVRKDREAWLAVWAKLRTEEQRVLGELGEAAGGVERVVGAVEAEMVAPEEGPGRLVPLIGPDQVAPEDEGGAFRDAAKDQRSGDHHDDAATEAHEAAAVADLEELWRDISTLRRALSATRFRSEDHRAREEPRGASGPLRPPIRSSETEVLLELSRILRARVELGLESSDGLAEELRTGLRQARRMVATVTGGDHVGGAVLVGRSGCVGDDLSDEEEELLAELSVGSHQASIGNRQQHLWKRRLETAYDRSLGELQAEFVSQLQEKTFQVREVGELLRMQTTSSSRTSHGSSVPGTNSLPSGAATPTSTSVTSSTSSKAEGGVLSSTTSISTTVGSDSASATCLAPPSANSTRNPTVSTSSPSKRIPAIYTPVCWRGSSGSSAPTAPTSSTQHITAHEHIDLERRRLLDRRRFLRSQQSVLYWEWRRRRRSLLEETLFKVKEEEQKKEEENVKNLERAQREVRGLRCRATLAAGSRSGLSSSSSSRISGDKNCENKFFSADSAIADARRESHLYGLHKLDHLEKKERVQSFHCEKQKQKEQQALLQADIEADLGEKKQQDLKLAAEHVARRAQIDQIKQEQRQREKELVKEAEAETKKKMEELLQKLAPVVEKDPERLHQRLERGVDYFDPSGEVLRGGTRGVFGYFEEKLRGDVRYKLSAALGNAGILDTDAGRRAFAGVNSVPLGKTHALNSANVALGRVL